MIDEKTLAQELEILKEIKDNYPKILLMLNDIGNGANYERIQINCLLGYYRKDGII